MRAWLHQLLLNHGPLTDLATGGVHSAESFDERPSDEPFVVHRFGEQRPGLTGDDVPTAYRWPVTIWVHCLPSAYLTIDEILAVLKGLLFTIKPPDGAQVIFLGEGMDGRDIDMGTIFRTATYEIVHT